MVVLKKNLFGIGLCFAIAFSFGFAPQDKLMMAPGQGGGGVDKIYCNCMTLGNKCKSRGSNARCAQSEEGGNIQCSAYNGNC